MSETSLAVRSFDWLNRQILERAASITALDSAMAVRFSSKGHAAHPIAIQPPWAIQEEVAATEDPENPFRIEHGLAGKRVLMHAGNHSAVHPLYTLFEAIRGTPGSNLQYFFVGGG